MSVTEEKAMPADNSSSLKGEKSNIVQTHEKMQHEFSVQTNSKVDSNNNMVNESKSIAHINTVIGDYDVTMGSNVSTQQLSSGFQKPGSVKQGRKQKDTSHVHLGENNNKAQTGAFDQIKDRTSEKDLVMHLTQNHIIKSDTKYNIGKDSDMVNKHTVHSNAASNNKSVQISKSNTETVSNQFEKHTDTSLNHSSNHSSNVNIQRGTERSVQRDIFFNETKMHFLPEGPEANKTATNGVHTTLRKTIESTVTTQSSNVMDIETSTKSVLENRRSNLKGTVSKSVHKPCNETC